ncbi:MAG: hypothetical protein KF690_11405 [Bacteroidetes bacterium]|nr:hypothetical protein [Bacteroidota bacterium]
MRLYSHYLYPLIWDAEGILTGRFPGETYSRYKYGSRQAAQELAVSLFHSTRSRFGEWLGEGPVYVTASAYKAVPTAAQQICNAFVELLNHYLQNRSGRRCIPFRILRHTVFSGDYGKLEVADRQLLMSQNILECEVPLRGARVIVLDDVRITGSHEHKVQQLMQAEGVSALLSLFIGKSLDISQGGHVEHLLNHNWMNSLERLYALTREPEWCVNARVCKYLLSYENKEELISFWQSLSADNQQVICENICADNYDRMPEYAAQYELLASHIHQQYTDIRLAHA